MKSTLEHVQWKRYPNSNLKEKRTQLVTKFGYLYAFNHLNPSVAGRNPSHPKSNHHGSLLLIGCSLNHASNDTTMNPCVKNRSFRTLNFPFWVSLPPPFSNGELRPASASLVFPVAVYPKRRYLPRRYLVRSPSRAAVDSVEQSFQQERFQHLTARSRTLTTTIVAIIFVSLGEWSGYEQTTHHLLFTLLDQIICFSLLQKIDLSALYFLTTLEEIWAKTPPSIHPGLI